MTSTPTITPTPTAVCNLGPVNSGGIVYTAIPRDVLRCAPVPSLGFEATSTREFGDRVGLASTGSLNSLTVLFMSFGCSVSGHWYTNNCVTTPGATFTHPITANFYACLGAPRPGALLATVTQTQNIAFRPSADPVNCTGADAGKWFNPATGVCQNAIGQLLTFTFPGGTHPRVRSSGRSRSTPPTSAPARSVKVPRASPPPRGAGTTRSTSECSASPGRRISAPTSTRVGRLSIPPLVVPTVTMVRAVRVRSAGQTLLDRPPGRWARSGSTRDCVESPPPRRPAR